MPILGGTITVWVVIVAVIAVIALLYVLSAWRKYRRAEFIRTYRWPAALLDHLEKRRPGLARKDSALFAQGLRQFFVAYLMSGKRYVSMPSQVADDLWHEFILYTRDYDRFCRQAFGTFLHHTPATVLTRERCSSNEGLRRVWWHCCKYESIDPVNPSRLPLLFALDGKLKIPGGFVYHPNCDALRRGGGFGGQCGADFASSSVDGSTSGFGDSGSSSDGGSSSGSDSGGGDGGGDSGGGGCGGGD